MKYRIEAGTEIEIDPKGHVLRVVEPFGSDNCEVGEPLDVELRNRMNEACDRISLLDQAGAFSPKPVECEPQTLKEAAARSLKEGTPKPRTFHINKDGVKRTILTPFEICGSSKDLDWLAEQIGGKEFSYGWVDIGGETTIIPNSKPTEWVDKPFSPDEGTVMELADFLKSQEDSDTWEEDARAVLTYFHNTKNWRTEAEVIDSGLNSWSDGYARGKEEAVEKMNELCPNRFTDAELKARDRETVNKVVDIISFAIPYFDIAMLRSIVINSMGLADSEKPNRP